MINDNFLASSFLHKFSSRIFHPYSLLYARVHGLIEFSNPSCALPDAPERDHLGELVVADVFSQSLEKTDPIFPTFAQIYLTVLASFPYQVSVQRPNFGEMSKYFVGNNVWRDITLEGRGEKKIRFPFQISSRCSFRAQK